MPHEHISDAEIDGWLNTLGITLLCQWDVLVFLYRHQVSLVGADVIARLLGYDSGPVIDALDVLESLGLVERSRVSQTARLYRFTVPSDSRRDGAWAHLLALASHRAGRVRLAKRWRGGDHTDQEQRHAAQDFRAKAQPSRRPGGGGTRAEEERKHG
jgi:hypothetical protein